MLNHVNTDIAVDIFEVLSELTDPEVLSYPAAEHASDVGFGRAGRNRAGGWGWKQGKLKRSL